MFTKTSTTSIVAVLFTVLGFALLGFIVVTGKPTDDTTRVQIITGVLALMGIPASYYFTASKNRPITGATGPTIANASEVNVTNPPAQDQQT